MYIYIREDYIVKFCSRFLL